MIGPDGQSYGEIPNDRVQGAVQLGGKVGTWMVAPDGSNYGVIPNERMMEALSVGARPMFTKAPTPTPNMQTSLAPQVVRGAVNSLPVAGATLGGLGGGLAGGPTVAGVPAGAYAGSGLGMAAGETARQALLRQIFGQEPTGQPGKRQYEAPSPTSAQGLQQTAQAGAFGTAAELGAGVANEYVIPPVAKAASRAWSRIIGYPKAIGEAAEAYADAGDAYTQGLRDRRIAIAQNKATYERAVEDFEAKQARIPHAETPVERQWEDLNKSIQVRPSTDIWMRNAPTSYSDSVIMPGRGLASENVDAARFAKLSPTQQNAEIIPMWNRAGQAVDQAADAATQQGRTVALPYIDEAINSQIKDPAMQQAIHGEVLRLGEAVGIRGPEGWTNATPRQVLDLRRALWKKGGDAAEAGARYVTQVLRDEVPELTPLDQHYTDLNGAKTVVGRHIGEMSSGKFKFAMEPEFDPTKVKYQPVPPVPDKPLMTRGAYQQIYNDQQLKRLLQGLGAGGVAGTGAELTRRYITGHW